MSYKDTIETSPSPDVTDADNPDAASQDAVSTDSNYSYSLRNRKFAPSQLQGCTSYTGNRIKFAHA